MKKLYSFTFAIVIGSGALNAQTFWTESFSNSCSAGCAADAYSGPNGAWTQTITGTEGADPNPWFVSCSENGNGAGQCGSGCGSNSNPTLHISAAIGNWLCPNDCGASYDAGGLCGTLSCPQTSRRIESPTINCSSINQPIAADFVYIANGSVPQDQCTFWYFDGTTWTMVQALPATPAICPGGQGLWTSITIPLPASAIGNANVKIGFEWINNDDGAGTDPSVAIDDITLSVSSGVLPITEQATTVTYDNASELLHIDVAPTIMNYTVEIVSISGQRVWAAEVNGNDYTANVGTMARGLYIVRITTQDKELSPLKLIVQ